MPYNPSRFNLKDRIPNAINNIAKRVRDIQNQNGDVTYFQKLTSDPVTPFEGQSWENITTHHIKVYLNGVVTTIV